VQVRVGRLACVRRWLVVHRSAVGSAFPALPWFGVQQLSVMPHPAMHCSPHRCTG
jgi:hypothetical protein